MTETVAIHFVEVDAGAIAAHPGRLAVFADVATPLSPSLKKIDRAMRGAIVRAVESAAFAALKPGDALDLAFPAGLAAEAVQLIRLPRKSALREARKAGAMIGKTLSKSGTIVLAEAHPMADEIAFGLAARAYDFTPHKTAEPKKPGPVRMMVARPEAVAATATAGAAVVEGLTFARDLVNEPANVLTTTDFAARLAAMNDLGLTVEILEEDALAKLGMGALLGVGQGSESPSKVVVMQWNGGGDEPPLALIGKGVVFDTGGISIKPAGGMEDMIMDMGGAATVAGTLRTLALRRAKANVVGLVGLVENMPDGKAQRPGDIVTSMKGDTIEVINTDAEGRLVLADVMWYAQERFKPAAMIDLATLTGAIIIALGHENTGVFSNDDAFCSALLAAAKSESEGAWRMPLSEAYDAKLKSRTADMMNVGGRDGGAITAAQFLQRFVKPGTPWAHLDIAGTAFTKGETLLSPKGPTGWGVMTLNRLIKDRFEKG